MLKTWYLWIVVLEKTLENPLDNKDIWPVNPKGNQPWIFIGRTDAEAETPVLWPTDAKSQLLEKTLMLGKIEGRRRRGWRRMRWLDGITDLMDTEFEQALGDGEWQGSPACCNPWDRKESDTTEQLNSCLDNRFYFQDWNYPTTIRLNEISVEEKKRVLDSYL